MRLGVVCVSWVTIILGLAGTSQAHPGHGTTDPQTVAHYLTEPVHLAPLMAVVAVSAAAISLLAARNRQTRHRG
ncbi:MAG: hypothetical protein KF861_05975 [Planctomycetaceae bacterium]|nr:hypothetical protein [Planctomycetaceae bacterium]